MAQWRVCHLYRINEAASECLSFYRFLRADCEQKLGEEFDWKARDRRDKCIAGHMESGIDPDRQTLTDIGLQLC